MDALTVDHCEELSFIPFHQCHGHSQRLGTLGLANWAGKVRLKRLPGSRVTRQGAFGASTTTSSGATACAVAALFIFRRAKRCTEGWPAAVEQAYCKGLSGDR